MPSRRSRLLVLLLIVVAIGSAQLLLHDPVPDWQRPLKVVVYPDNVDHIRAAARRIASLEPDRFDRIERYFVEQAARYASAPERPFEFELAEPVESAPGAPDYSSPLAYLRWGIALRWWYWWVFDDQGRNPDIVMIARYRDAAVSDRLHSLGVPAMDLAIANLAAGAERGFNDFVLAHELLHTVGASDLYDRESGLPRYPEGFADPDQRPIYPQKRAELMAGRIALGPRTAAQPEGLGKTAIGPRTAAEIGWREP